ncbi:uncharacterized protein LOC121784683 [Salvia splendens]|uniref:uncharacterized protein LOC121784683 n=1 Tax=Salvia splendens TaxID=180675 RepID=UPI001C2548A6|nr:uncharacterized protein LOC121784683 [Salvia splendens]
MGLRYTCSVWEAYSIMVLFVEQNLEAVELIPNISICAYGFSSSHYYSTSDGDGLPRPVVEILKVCGDDPQLLPVFLNASLRRCCPKCITAFNKVYYQRHDAALNWYPAFEYYRRHDIDVEKRDAALLQVMDQ